MPKVYYFPEIGCPRYNFVTMFTSYLSIVASCCDAHTHTEKRIKKVECENGSNPLQTWPIPTACHLDLYLVWHDDLNGDTPATFILNVLMGGKNKNTCKVVETTCVTSGVINHLCAPPIIWWTFSLPNLVKPCKLSWLDGVLTKSSWLCKTCGRTQPGTRASLVLPIRMDIDMISTMISMYGMNGHLMSSDILKLECYNA